MTSISYASLRGVRIGEGSDYPFRAMPSGFGVRNTRASTVVQGADGQRFLGADQLAPLTLTFDVHVIATTPVLRQQAAETLQAAWGPTREGVTTLIVAVNGIERVVFGRPLRCEVDYSRLAFGTIRARCIFETSDARIFDATVDSIVLGLSPGGGVTAPVTAPVTAGVGSDSDGTATNTGTFETEWVAVVQGPVTGPRLTLASTGETVEIDGTVPAGSQLIVSSTDGSVLLNGSPRQNWVSFSSRFFKLPAGANTVRFRAASGTGSCTFSWRSARL